MWRCYESAVNELRTSGTSLD